MDKALSKGMVVHRPPIEDFDGAEDIVHAFLDVGCVDHSGFGDLPLSWQSIMAWRSETEQSWLDPGSIEAVREMSMAYVLGIDQYKERLEPSPYQTDEAQEKAKLDKAIRSAFDALVTRRPSANKGVRKNVRVDKTK